MGVGFDYYACSPATLNWQIYKPTVVEILQLSADQEQL